MTDQELQRVLDGFDQRVKDAFEADRGKPLVRAAKHPPLGPGRGDYIRHYSWSLVDFATRCLLLNEQIDAANAALAENAQEYIDNPLEVNDWDNFHWHSEMLCRLIEWYGKNGSREAGRIQPETENLMIESLWLYSSQFVWPGESETEVSQTWRTYGSENHHTMDFVTKWHFAKLARNHSLYRDRKYQDGSTLIEQYKVWNKYIKQYCLERGRKGWLVERGSDDYNVVAMKGLHNILDFAEDPVIRRRVGYLLDLHWALWAQEQIDGVRGGGRARIAKHGSDRLGDSELRDLAWFYFGIGQPRLAVSPLLAALTSSWRPPLVVADLVLDVKGRGCYEVLDRPMGLGEIRDSRFPGGRQFDLESGSIVSYSWCTPEFILGTMMVEARPAEDWANISSHNRWNGVIFAGDVNARIVPQVDGAHRAFNAHWSVQRKGTLICQKLKTNVAATDMRVWFAKTGLSTPVEENGWVFAEAPGAYAAVRIVTGGTEWKPAERETLVDIGNWLQCRDEWSPVILEVARKDDFKDYASFRKSIATTFFSFEDNVLNYKGLSGDSFTFFADQTKSPLINNQSIDYTPSMAFNSPFVKGEWNGGIVTIAKDGRTLKLDFLAD